MSAQWFFFKFYLYMYVLIYFYVHPCFVFIMYCMYAWYQHIEVADSCEQPCDCWELNLGPQQEQNML